MSKICPKCGKHYENKSESCSCMQRLYEQNPRFMNTKRLNCSAKRRDMYDKRI